MDICVVISFINKQSMTLKEFNTIIMGLPSDYHGKRLNIYPWLDGCGWSLDYEGFYHIEFDLNSDSALSKLLNFAEKILNLKQADSDYWGKRHPHDIRQLEEEELEKLIKKYKENGGTKMGTD